MLNIILTEIIFSHFNVISINFPNETRFAMYMFSTMHSLTFTCWQSSTYIWFLLLDISMVSFYDLCVCYLFALSTPAALHNSSSKIQSQFTNSPNGTLFFSFFFFFFSISFYLSSFFVCFFFFFFFIFFYWNKLTKNPVWKIDYESNLFKCNVIFGIHTDLTSINFN